MSIRAGRPIGIIKDCFGLYCYIFIFIFHSIIKLATYLHLLLVHFLWPKNLTFLANDSLSSNQGAMGLAAPA